MSRALLLLLVGCSSLPQARTPPAERAAAALPKRLCVAPVRIAVSQEEKQKGHGLVTLADAKKVAQEMRRWLDASGAFAGVRVADGAAAQDEAWQRREDLLLETSLNDLAVVFEGHNGRWIPNLALWFMVAVPAWYVATDEYALTFTAEWTLRSVDSGAVLAEGKRKVRVPGTLDLMDRGWKVLGVLRPKNDAENWRRIAGLFLDAGRAEAAAAITDGLLKDYVPRATDPELRRRMKKTMAVVIGVSEYRNPLHAPPLPYAASDAKAVAAALGLPERHVTLLLDRDATKKNVARALRDLRERTHEGDQLVVYFAGYGTRAAKGKALLTSEADPAGAGSLPLKDVADLLRGVEGEGIVLLDCSFDGRGRSLRGRDPVAEQDDLGAVVTTIRAAADGDHLVTPEQVRASLFAFHVVRSLRGEADREPDGVVTPGELFEFVHENVVADAAFVGKRQRPRAAGLERPVLLRLKR